MVEIALGNREKVKALLKKLFQFDTQDLDFGIYRIMNFKRKEIEKFIEEDLIKAAEAEFREYAKAGMGDLKKEVETLRAEINRDFGEGTIDKLGRVKKHEDAPKIEEYQNKMKELESAEVTQAQIEDVFNHVYEFFSRYYDKGDFLSKRRYGGREKYYVPYNGEEVLLHWATRDQYYVKTGEYFKKYSFKAGGHRVNFVLKEAETELNNVKTGNRYFLPSNEDILKLDEENKELDIYFNYQGLTDDEKKKYRTRNVQETITSDIVNKLLSEIGDKGPGIELRRRLGQDGITVLEKHIAKYVKRNTTDYFIHKNLKSFLERELEFYLKNEVLNIDEIEHMDERNIRINKAKIRAIKGISNKVVGFLAQIEGFQKKLFERKKFVLKTNYCITLDLVPEEFYREIGENEQQVTEWKKLFKLDEITEGTLESTNGKKTLDVNFLKAHKNLVLDTEFFDQELKDRLLASFDNLDEKIGGVIIKGENFQALNLLMEKYKDKVKSIYIDPPYNTGNDEFLYKDNYQHSSWLTMLENRLEKAYKLLMKNGAIFISIDDNELFRLKALLLNHFSMVIVVPVVTNLKGNQDQYGFAGTHEYFIVGIVDSSRKDVVGEFPLSEEEKEEYDMVDALGKYKRGAPLMRTGEAGAREFRPTTFFPVYVTAENKVFVERQGSNDVELYPKTLDGKEMSWRWSPDTFRKNASEIIVLRKGEHITLYKKQRLGLGELSAHKKPKSVFYKPGYSSGSGTEQIKNIFGSRCFDNPKPLELIKDIVTLSAFTDKRSIVLDFYAGSGTTGHAVLNLNAEDGGNRKYILVEMADHFNTVLLPRIKKLMFSKEWRDASPSSTEGRSHMFKYLYLEEYEDTLNNIVFRALDKTIQETLDGFKDYFFRYMLDFETRDSPTRLMVQKFQTPFDYKIKVIKNGKKEEFVNVDLIETFNYLLGLEVDRLRVLKDGDRIYRVVFGEDGKNSIVVIWRNTTDLNLEKDKKFIEEAILNGNEPNFIFINGDNYVKNAKAIEPEFKKLMAGA